MSANGRIVARLLALVVFMGAAAWAAVPFYDWFCRATGYGGTTQRADAAGGEVLDQTVEIRFDANVAKDMARRSASEEGMLVGISSGATLAAILQKLPDLPDGTRVLGFNYDTGERYLSVPDFLPEI